MDTLFVAETREAAAYLEVYEATFSPDPLPNPLSCPATPDAEQLPAIVEVPSMGSPVEVAADQPPAIAEVRPMPRPEHRPEQGYCIAYRNPSGSFLSLLKKMK